MSDPSKSASSSSSSTPPGTDKEILEDITKEILCLFGNDFDFLDSTKSWLSSEVKRVEDENADRLWLEEPFKNEELTMIADRLVSELRALKYSPNRSSYDTRTYTRNKKLGGTVTKKPAFSAKNTNGLSKFMNDDIMEECAPHQNANEAFNIEENEECDISRINSDVQLAVAKRLNETFTPPKANQNGISNKNETTQKQAATTYLDVHEIARMQEETLCSLEPVEARCSSGSSQSNGFCSRTHPESVEDHFNTNLYEEYEEAPSQSTPLHPRFGGDGNHRNSARNSPPKIMPYVTNLKYGERNSIGNIGRSLPNLSRRMAGVAGGGVTHEGSNLYLSKQNGDSSNKVNGVRQEKTIFRAPQGHPHLTGRHPNQAAAKNQAVNNIKRTGTFKVRPLQACNSDENIRLSNQNNNEVEECSLGKSGPLKSVTNIRAVNGYGGAETTQPVTDNRMTSVQKPSSKIPGPKTARSGIPIPGARSIQLPQPVSKLSAKQSYSQRDVSSEVEDDKHWTNGSH